MLNLSIFYFHIKLNLCSLIVFLKKEKGLNLKKGGVKSNYLDLFYLIYFKLEFLSASIYKADWYTGEIDYSFSMLSLKKGQIILLYKKKIPKKF